MKSNYLVESAVSQVEKVPGTLKPMLAHQQKCHTKQKSPFLCKNLSIEKGEILNETQGPTGPKRHLS
jgi:hypothetical protein